MNPLTEPQRDLIRKHFPSNSNVDIKLGNGEYALSHNAHVNHGNKSIAFRNENGKLKAGVSHYSHNDTKRRGSPVVHTDHEISGEDDMKKIKNL